MKTSIAREIKDYLLISLGVFIYAVGVTYFMLPYELTTGGLTGVSVIIYYASGLEIQYTYFFFNAMLLLLAIKILGFKFCIRTIYCVVFMTFVLWALQRMATNPMTHKLPQLAGNQSFMACVLGGCLEGIGLAFCFSNNGSTGGTDIIAAIVNKYRSVSLGQVLMICDIFIISSCYFVFHDWEKIVFGFVLLIISNSTLDYVMSRNNQSVQFMIFSRNHGKIADAINATGRGVTVLDGMGWYTKTERKVVVTLVKKRESLNIFRTIKAIDPYAFVSMGNVAGVYGDGFDEIKVRNMQKGKTTLVFASNSENKLREVREILGDKFDIRSLADIGCNVDIPETADTLKGNALLKAQYVKKYYGFDCFADDTGLECTALDGEPGVYTARYAGGEGHDRDANMRKLLRSLKDCDDRTAQFRTVIALIYNGETHYFEGAIHGKIATERRGDGGFGYDPLFIPDGYDGTFAELPSETKNSISHRALAVNKLATYLKNEAKPSKDA